MSNEKFVPLINLDKALFKKYARNVPNQVKSAGLNPVGTFSTPEIPPFAQKGLESNDFARGGGGVRSNRFSHSIPIEKREKTTGWYGMIPLDFSPQLKQNDRKTTKEGPR